MLQGLKCAVLALIVLTVSAGSQNSPKPTAWTPDLTMKVKTVGAVQPSPDGKHVVYTVTSAVMAADKSEYLTQIFLATSDGRDTIQMTYGDKSSSNPKWSPDGRWIAFTSSRAGKANLYRIRANGGEAEQISDVKGGIGTFDWSPDGTHIAYTQPDPPTDEEEKETKGKDDARFVDERLKMSRLWVMPVEKDAAGKREPRKLTAGDYSVSDFNWSPDGKKIAFSHTKTAKTNDFTTADISTVEVATGQVSAFANTGASETSPRFSPDGRWIAYLATDDPPHWAHSANIWVAPSSGGTGRRLPDTFDAQPALVDWSSDSKRLYYTEGLGTRTRLCSIDAQSGQTRELNNGDEVLGGVTLNHRRDQFGFTKQSPNEPSEAYVSGVGNFRPTRVSEANRDLASVPFGKTEVVRWKSKDGQDVEGLLTLPVGYEKGKRYPLLTVIHGGPTGVFSQSFTGSPSPYPIAVFASRGYAVLRCNPRGSSGYGRKFRYANDKDWGGGDYQDIMTGVDYVIAQGIADPDRLGVMGWSYGGYMTSWIITQTKRFKAASVGAGVTNLVSMTPTTDVTGLIPSYFGGQPWENTPLYEARSAMFNIKGVTTPTLIEHGEADFRVPITQGYELYYGLKSQNVPVRMLVLPRQPHGPNEPKMMLKAMVTNLEWFEKYVKG